MERVLAVEVLHLLAAEGMHGQVVADRLAASEVWQAYQGQRHDLFLPGGATPQVRTVLRDGCLMHGQTARGPQTVEGGVAACVWAGCHATWLHGLWLPCAVPPGLGRFSSVSHGFLWHRWVCWFCLPAMAVQWCD